MVILNNRRVYIIQSLLKQHSPTTVQKLAEELECSERTLRDDIKAIDDWLKQHKFPRLLKKPRVGIVLEVDLKTRKEIGKVLRSITIESYELSRSERVIFISLLLLTTSSPLTIKKFEDLFFISRGTIKEDLKEVESFMRSFDLVLHRQTNRGVWVDGSEINFRHALTSLCKEMSPVLIQIVAVGKSNNTISSPQLEISESMKQLTDTLQMKEIQGIVDPILHLLDVPLSDNGRAALYLHIGMAIKRLKSEKSVILREDDLESIFNQKEFQVAQILSRQIEEHFEIKIPDNEIAYVTLHLLGNQNAPVLPKKMDILNETKLYSILLKTTLIVERLLETKFNNREQLLKGLLLHIRPAIYRARYGLHIENPLLADLKKEFGEVYQAVQKSIHVIEKEYDAVFSEEEIAYITMHYGSALTNTIENDDSPLRILIICSSGIGTASLLKTRIKKLFSNIHILKTLSYQMFLEKKDWDADLIVSTIEITSSSLPVLTVNPLLPNEDYKKLSLFAQPKEKSSFTSQQLYEAIWPIINNHCDIKDPKSLTEDLIKKFQGLLDERVPYPNFSLGSLDGVLKQDYIQLDKQAKDWQDAINCGIRPLERVGIVPAVYKDEIISILKERGPYMAVAPGILLAHGSASNEIQKVSLSFTRLNPPVSFGHEKNDPISFLFVFASPNRSSHVPALQQLLEQLIDERNRRALAKAKGPSDVLKIFIKQDKEETVLV